MRTALESYPTYTPKSSQTAMMRDFNVVMNEVETFDEREVITQLTDDTFHARAEVLEGLRAAVRVHQQLPFPNIIGLFQAFDHVLSDTNWDVRRQCMTLISEYMPHLRNDVDACLSLILPRLIFNIGDHRIVIRRSVIQTLHTYMKYTNDMPLLMHYYIKYGFENVDPKVRKESTVALPLLITADFASEDFTDIIASLCKKLVDREEDDHVHSLALSTLNKIRTSTGDQKFKSYLMKLQVKLREYYCNKANFQFDAVEPASPTQQFYNGGSSVASSQSQPLTELYFGVIPPLVMNQLSDENFRNRSQAIEQLKLILENLHSINPLISHIEPFLSMLNNLLEDNNFRIITVTLEIIGILVEKSSQEIRPHLKPVLQTLTKRMGDNKNVIRQAITKVITQLMQILGPKLVLLMLCDNLSHRSPRVRSEAINSIINALLTFPSYEFDLPSLCSSMAYCLLDSKRGVRHASLECFAVLAQCLGAGKLQPLSNAVENLEQSYGSDSEGIMAAVQARLSRRSLPRRNEDNLIEYAVQLPNPNASRNGSLGHQGADVDWILAGSGTGGTSARSMRLEDLESTSRQSSASLDGRRHLSAGKKSKLPWEEGQSPKAPESPMKPKQTWADEPNLKSPKKSGGKGSRQREDLLLASVNYTASSSPTHSIDSLTVEGSAHLTGSAPSNSKPAGTFSKSDKSPKAESSSTNRTVKPSSKDASAEFPGQSKSFSGRPMLNPLPVGEGTTAASAFSSNTWEYDESTPPMRVTPPSNIPIKAAPINRKNGAKKPGRMPPIPKSLSPVATADDVGEGGGDGNGEVPQLNASLNKIRSSASKKKLTKLFEKLERQDTDPTPSPTTNKSFSTNGDNPFEAKPKLARHNSQAKSKSYSELSNERPEKIPAVQPISGLNNNGNEPKLIKSDSLVSKIKQSSSRSSVGSTTPDKGEMVAVVGKGYTDETVGTPPKHNSVKKRRPSKVGTGSSLSPLGLSASSAPGMIPIDDDADLVSVIGRGMFEGGDSGKEREFMKRGDKSNNNSKSQSSGYSTLTYPTSESIHALDDEEVEQETDSLQMSKGLKERAQQKKIERQEEAAAAKRLQKEKELAAIAAQEKRNLEQEQELKKKKQQQEIERRELAESRRQAEANTQLRIAGNSPIKTPAPSSTSPAIEGVGKDAFSSGVMSPGSIQSQHSLVEEVDRPFTKPSVAFKDAMRLIATDDWSNKMDAIAKIRRLSRFHTDVLSGSVHAVTLAILAEVQNLRSQVARLAITALADMFSSLKKLMDTELDTCAKVLLPKNGETNEFIRAELEKTLVMMVNETTPHRCLAAIILAGSQHKNPLVRTVAAQHMLSLCDKLGPGKLLSGVKDLTDKIVPAVASLCRDASQLTRWYARNILLAISQHPDFEPMLRKHTTAKDTREVLQTVETLKVKGIGEMPSDTPSAKGTRRSGTMNRASRTSSADSTLSNATSVASRKPVGGSHGSEEAGQLLEKMTASQWNIRYDGISDLVSIVQTKPRIVSAQSIKIFDKYSLLVKDSNSKVALHALESLSVMLSQVRQDIPPASVTLLVQNTATGLASKNKDIYEKTSNLLDAFINNIDHTVLFLPFVQVAMNATAKTKPDVIDRVTYLSKKVYSVKPKQVTLHGLPLAWNLAKSISSGGCTSILRESISDYIAQLYNLIGPSLFDLCASAPGSNPQLVAQVRELSGSKAKVT